MATPNQNAPCENDPHTGSQSRALAVFHVLFASEQAFKRGDRDQGWSLLEHAEQSIPEVEDGALFQRAQRHADRVWKMACQTEVVVDRQDRKVSFKSGIRDLTSSLTFDLIEYDRVFGLGGDLDEFGGRGGGRGGLGDVGEG